MPYNAELTEWRRFDRETVTQASVCAACAEWSWLLAHAFAHGCQLPRCDGRTSLVTDSYAYARHVQRVPPASAAAPSGAKLASHRACVAFGVTLGTLLDEDTTEGPSERARLMWPCRDPGNSGAEGRRLFRSPLSARQLPVDTDLGAPPRLRNVFLNSVQIGSRPATKVQALASPATKPPWPAWAAWQHA